MTSYYTLTPTPNAPFQFSPTLDGNIYNVVVPFLAAGQRYYLNIYTLAGDLVAAVPVVASPVALNIEGIVWDQSTNSAILTTISPHNYSVGATLVLTVSGCVPDAYNGTFTCLVTSPTEISYTLPSGYPGAVTTLGAIGKNINLVAGYFTTSTMVFREGMNYFEVSP